MFWRICALAGVCLAAACADAPAKPADVAEATMDGGSVDLAAADLTLEIDLAPHACTFELDTFDGQCVLVP